MCGIGFICAKAVKVESRAATALTLSRTLGRTKSSLAFRRLQRTCPTPPASLCHASEGYQLPSLAIGKLASHIQNWITQRGLDVQSMVSVDFSQSQPRDATQNLFHLKPALQDEAATSSLSSPHDLFLLSSVLHLRGSLDTPTPQPLSNHLGALLWNGEVFGGVDLRVGENDGIAILRRITSAITTALTQSSSAFSTTSGSLSSLSSLSQPSTPTESTHYPPRHFHSAILSAMRDVSGPYAFAFVSALDKTIYFGRDRFGKRSLMISLPTLPSSSSSCSSASPVSSCTNETINSSNSNSNNTNKGRSSDPLSSYLNNVGLILASSGADLSQSTPYQDPSPPSVTSPNSTPTFSTPVSGEDTAMSDDMSHPVDHVDVEWIDLPCSGIFALSLTSPLSSSLSPTNTTLDFIPWSDSNPTPPPQTTHSSCPQHLSSVTHNTIPSHPLSPLPFLKYTSTTPSMVKQAIISLLNGSELNGAATSFTPHSTSSTFSSSSIPSSSFHMANIAAAHGLWRLSRAVYRRVSTIARSQSNRSYYSYPKVTLPSSSSTTSSSPSLPPSSPSLQHQLDDPHPARIGVLFSGGVDCTVLALLIHAHLQAQEEKDHHHEGSRQGGEAEVKAGGMYKGEPIDLINVAFVGEKTDMSNKLSQGRNRDKNNSNMSNNIKNLNYSNINSFINASEAPDRVAARNSLQELQALAPTREFRLICVDITLDDLQAHADAIRSLSSPRNTVMDFNISAVLYFGSRALGTLDPTETDLAHLHHLRDQGWKGEDAQVDIEEEIPQKLTKAEKRRLKAMMLTPAIPLRFAGVHGESGPLLPQQQQEQQEGHVDNAGNGEISQTQTMIKTTLSSESHDVKEAVDESKNDQDNSNDNVTDDSNVIVMKKDGTSIPLVDVLQLKKFGLRKLFSELDDVESEKVREALKKRQANPETAMKNGREKRLEKWREKVKQKVEEKNGDLTKGENSDGTVTDKTLENTNEGDKLAPDLGNSDTGTAITPETQVNIVSPSHGSSSATSPSSPSSTPPLPRYSRLSSDPTYAQHIFETTGRRTYRSQAAVLFLGTGADELLGGYGRHRTAWRVAWKSAQLRLNGEITSGYEKSGAARSSALGSWVAQHLLEEEKKMKNLGEAISEMSEGTNKGEVEGSVGQTTEGCGERSIDLNKIISLAADVSVRRELDIDTSRLWIRNLGRDDRSLSHWNREARHPFLDDEFVEYCMRFGGNLRGMIKTGVEQTKKSLQSPNPNRNLCQSNGDKNDDTKEESTCGTTASKAEDAVGGEEKSKEKERGGEGGKGKSKGKGKDSGSGDNNGSGGDEEGGETFEEQFAADELAAMTGVPHTSGYGFGQGYIDENHVGNAGCEGERNDWKGLVNAVVEQEGDSELATLFVNALSTVPSTSMAMSSQTTTTPPGESKVKVESDTLTPHSTELLLEYMCDMRLDQGAGDKRLLRLAAKSMGLKDANRLLKRAMQFGTRIANKKIEGTTPMTKETAIRSIVNPNYFNPK